MIAGGHFGITLELIWGTVGVFFGVCRVQEPKKEGAGRRSEPEPLFSDFGVYPKILRRVLAAAGARFSLWQPVAHNVDFGFLFGVILGAESSSRLTLGCP